MWRSHTLFATLQLVFCVLFCGLITRALPDAFVFSTRDSLNSSRLTRFTMEIATAIIHYLTNHWVDLLGYIASCFVAASFYMKTIIPLRIFAILSNVFFISYATMAGLYPVLVLHIFLFPLNIIRLRQMKQLISDVKSAIEDETAVDPLLPYMTKLKYNEGDILFRKGEQADKMYYIGKGSIRLADLDIIVSENQIIGEMGIFSPFKERTDTAVCASDLEVYMIDEDKINQLYYQNPSFGFYLIRLLTKRFILNANMLNEKLNQQNPTTPVCG